jgi:uncharacterized protein GlcG (DUF336 family)
MSQNMVTALIFGLVVGAAQLLRMIKMKPLHRALVGGSAIGVILIGIGLSFSRTVHADDAVPVAAPTTKPAVALETKDISLAQAHDAVMAAVQKATEINTKMDVAVVDAGGNLKAFVRMDGAWIGSIDIAIKKAKTARFFDMNSGDIGKLSQPGGPLYQIEVSNGGLVSFPGGVPIKSADGTIIGAIGVSGSTVDNDHAVAAAGAAAIK